MRHISHSRNQVPMKKLWLTLMVDKYLSAEYIGGRFVEHRTFLTGNNNTDYITIQRGICHACVPFIVLLSSYAEHIIKTALEEKSEDVKINEIVGNKIRYASGTVLLLYCVR